MICSNSFAPTSDVGDTRGGADEPIEIESSSDEEVYHIIHVYNCILRSCKTKNILRVVLHETPMEVKHHSHEISNW